KKSAHQSLSAFSARGSQRWLLDCEGKQLNDKGRGNSHPFEPLHIMGKLKPLCYAAKGANALLSSSGLTMNWLPMRILLGNRAKYVAMLFGITFASMLICQQCSIFCGAMRMCTGQIRDVEDACIWVLSPQTRYIDDLDPLSDRHVEEVRSVPGVAWAVPLQKGYG